MKTRTFSIELLLRIITLSSQQTSVSLRPFVQLETETVQSQKTRAVFSANIFFDPPKLLFQIVKKIYLSNETALPKGLLSGVKSKAFMADF